MESQETAKVLFMAYRGLVSRIALRHSPFPALVDDIVHQVFIEFVSKADSWDLGTDVRALLSAMTRNVARRHWDKEKARRNRDMRDLAEHIRGLLEKEEDEDEAENIPNHLQQLRLCMATLPEKSRTLLELYYFDNIPVKDLSAEMQIHTDSVYQAMYRLRLKLKRCIENAMKKEGRHA